MFASLSDKGDRVLIGFRLYKSSQNDPTNDKGIVNLVCYSFVAYKQIRSRSLSRKKFDLFFSHFHNYFPTYPYLCDQLDRFVNSSMREN